MAPVCSSFVFANSVKCVREPPDYIGNVEYLPVTGGNLMAQVSAFFMLLAARRAIYAAMENPAGSTIFNFAPVRNILEALQVVYQTTDSCAFSPVAYGKRSLKRFKIAGSGPWIHGISRKCRCPFKGADTHAELMRTGPDGRVSGTPALKASQAYSKSFGAHIIRIWEDGSKNKLPPCQVPQAIQVSKVSGSASDTGRKRSPPRSSWTSPFLVGAAEEPASTATSSGSYTLWTEPFSSSKASRVAPKAASKAIQPSPPSTEDWQTVGTIGNDH